ncbi:conserved hypothetical protein [Trichinella spiralis]|uniref:hypothetical protein n=1 Tax=Trichinella spiralis TaxID=6334 RepID=UPI0001EFD4EA|nr:conserved hypothetical protein [Trichinella spiralis]
MKFAHEDNEWNASSDSQYDVRVLNLHIMTTNRMRPSASRIYFPIAEYLDEVVQKTIRPVDVVMLFHERYLLDQQHIQRSAATDIQVSKCSSTKRRQFSLKENYQEIHKQLYMNVHLNHNNTTEVEKSSVKKYDKITSSISPIIKRSSNKTSEVHAACIKQMEIKYKFYVILLLQRASLLRKRFAASK